MGPWGFSKSKYAEAPTTERMPRKRWLTEDDTDDQTEHEGARSTKRAREVDNAYTPGPSTATFPNIQTLPSEWSGYAWASANTTMRNEGFFDISSDREETTERSTVDRDTLEREPIHGVMIKQEPLADDVPTLPPSNPLAHTYGTPIPPVFVHLSRMNQAPMRHPIQPVAPNPAHTKYDLWELCTPYEPRLRDRSL